MSNQKGYRKCVYEESIRKYAKISKGDNLKCVCVCVWGGSSMVKSCLLLMHQNEYLWSKGLTLYHTIPSFNKPEKKKKKLLKT